MLSACGGGNSEGSGPQAAATSSAERERPQALTVASVDAKALFDWAQYKFPTLFSNGPQNLPYSDGGVNYTIRAYPNGNYLGLTTGGDIYGYGPFTNFVLTPFGKLSTYAPQVVADACGVDPASCVPSPPSSGALNECIDPVAASLPTGFRVNLVIAYSGGLTGEQTVDSLVDGPGFTFEGLSATQTTSTTSGSNTVSGVSLASTTKVKTYQQPGSGSLWKTLGSQIESSTGGLTIGGITLPPTTSLSKVVFNPPYQNLEFTLSLGQSITITSSQTTTVSGSPPVSSTYSQTYTFEAKEAVTTSFGRTFNTCRYKITDGSGSATTTWYLLGKGVPVKTQSTGGGVTTTLELKSGTYNGAAL